MTSHVKLQLLFLVVVVVVVLQFNRCLVFTNTKFIIFLFTYTNDLQIFSHSHNLHPKIRLLKNYTDKQQEDLDLPYLQQSNSNSQQQLNNSNAITSAEQQGDQNQQLEMKAPTSQISDMKQLLPAGSNNKQQLASTANQSPILVTKSASSSSVLSSVSLSSGAQMRPPQTQTTTTTTAVAQQQQELPLNETGSGEVVKQEPEELEAPSSEKKIEVNLETETKTKDNEQKQQEGEAKLSEQQIARDPQIQTPRPKIRELKQLLRHTNSLNQLPEFGVETQNEEELRQLVEQIDVWGLNIFEVHQFSQSHSLTVVMYKIFKVSFIQ